MNGILFNITAFVIAIGVLITVHEFGHFWVARRLGVKVLRFSIGFGKPILRWGGKQGDTEYVLSAIPLGGYVKMLDEHEGEVPEKELPLAFNRQPIKSRFAIVSAGPLFNFIFAIFAYWLMFVIGITGLKPVLGEVEVDSIAYRAGLRQGDVITSINDKTTPTWEGVMLVMLDNVMENKALEMEVYDKNKQQHVHTITTGQMPELLNQANILKTLGIQPLRPHLPAVIGKISEGGAADRAGMKAGDRLLSADGQVIKDWIAWVNYVRQRPGLLIHLTVEREGSTRILELRPERKSDPEAGDIGYIGASVFLPASPPESLRAVLQYGPFEAIGQSVIKTWDISVLTLRMLGKMLIGEASIKNISGPITIAQYAGQSASIGMTQFLAFLAIVSISLGVLNLLPIPLLDGGHLFYYLVEIVQGKPMSEEAQMFGQRVGIAILAILMSIAFYNDIARLIN